MATMKTTLDIHDELPIRAKRHAKETGRPWAIPWPCCYEFPELRVQDPFR